MTWKGWAILGGAYALVIGWTAAIPLPAVLGRFEGDDRQRSGYGFGQGNLAAKETPEEGLRYALRLGEADVTRALERAGVAGKPAPEELLERLECTAHRDLSMTRAHGETRWKVGWNGWSLNVALELPKALLTGPERSAFVEALAVEIHRRQLDWLRREFPCVPCFQRALGPPLYEIEPAEFAREVLACLRALATDAERERLLTDNTGLVHSVLPHLEPRRLHYSEPPPLGEWLAEQIRQLEGVAAE